LRGKTGGSVSGEASIQRCEKKTYGYRPPFHGCGTSRAYFTEKGIARRVNERGETKGDKGRVHGVSRRASQKSPLLQDYCRERDSSLRSD